MAAPGTTYTSYYWSSEKHCACFMMRDLEAKLPPHGNTDPAYPEYGTTMFRWRDEETGGWRYAYQSPVYKGDRSEWGPLGRIPAGTEEWAYGHTHPNNSYFSSIDVETAKGIRGLFKKKTIMYMVNRKGAFWYDGRTDYPSDNDRKGTLWRNPD